MAVPSNGVYIVQGEMSLVVTAMRRGVRWTSHSHLDEDNDPLARNFSDLKEILNHISDLSDLEPNSYLSPFLDVIRSEDTTGPVTGLALSSVNKFLSYGLLEPANVSASAAVENITDAVTHARFVGTDPGSDEVVLMKILQVLRTLVLTPVGTLLTNESVCEIMQSCFRICFEMRLSELLRKSAEHALMDMVQLLFARLPQFSEDSKWNLNFKKLKMRASGMDTSRNKQRKRSPHPRHKKMTNINSHKPDELHLSVSSTQLNALSPDSGMGSPQDANNGALSNTLHTIATSTSCPALDSEVELTSVVVDKNEDLPPPSGTSFPHSGPPSVEDNLTVPTPLTTPGDEMDITDSFHFASSESIREESKAPSDSSSQSWVDAGQLTHEISSKDIKAGKLSEQYGRQLSSSLGDINDDQESVVSAADIDYINSQGVRFTQQQQARDGAGTGVLIPYGLPCVRELFRFLVSLINPVDKHNSDIMIHIGLSLLTVALETGADHINNFNSLLSLVRDDLCRNLFLLISSIRMPVFAAMLRVCFLLFESLRSHLKFQLEMYLTKLMDIIASESSHITYEQHEMVLDAVVQLWRIPGLVTELYLNYDCDLYCFNLFEDLTKLLSKNAFPVSGMLYSTHLLSLDALLTVVDSIETHCHSRILNERQSHEKVQLAERVSSERKDSLDSDKSTNGDITTSVSASGFLLAQQLLNKEKSSPNNVGSKLRTSTTRANRMKLSDKIPNHEQIMAIKHKKKLLASGTEHFNSKPSKGIQFLQDNNLLSSNLEPLEVVTFLKENPRLDKKMIGEFVSSRKNLKVLETFVKSFNFEDTRVDEALRMYLETFRLPGEAPVISLLLEHFAEHWHKSNGEPFANNDAAFTLAYAVIMLNVDQHNNNVKKQNNPMTLEEFRKNLTKVNGGQDFDQDMLEEVYNAIRSDEIVMPAEHTGLVKENYMWKVLLRRGSSKDGSFIHAPNGIFDHDLFSLTWGPTVAALSFVFDKSPDEIIIQRAISGFRKCAMISAHYGMSDVFDNLVISLCKFTTLLSSTEAPECLPVTFGSNAKAQLAAKTVFNLAHRHGDILREGWKNLLDCMLQLFKAKLLPKDLVEAEDFTEPYGHISLIREEVPSQRVDSGLFSSFYSYITLTSESQSQRGPTPEDLEAQQRAQACIQDCHPEQLVTESKFLQMDSLQELVKALIFASHAPDGHISLSGSYDEDTVVFFLELLIKIVLQNRDRVSAIWSGVRDHIYSLVMGASASEHTFLMERAVVGILRLAIRLLRREDMTAQVLQSLRMLLLLKPHTLYCVSRQISFALYELLKTTAANIHTSQDWSTLFTLLECAGAGAKPPRIMNGSAVETPEVAKDTGAQSDSEISSGHATQDSGVGSDRGYTSDSELSYGSNVKHSPQHVAPPEVPIGVNSSASGGWILVGKAGEIETVQVRPLPVNQYNIIFQRELLTHDTSAFVKACESLAFLVRDVAHITPENFESCVHCIRTFVEASLNGGKNITEKRNGKHRDSKERKTAKGSRRSRDEPQITKRPMRRSPSGNSAYQADDEDEAEELPGTYHQLSIQLLDLMHTLHTRAASIFSSWVEEEGPQILHSAENSLSDGSLQYAEQLQNELSEEAIGGSLWTKCWCPLLQGIARLCCDTRRAVRTSAVTYLQRALLVHDLQMLSPLEWEACFNKVLFPLLAKLLESIVPSDPVGMEETRMRGATLLCKVFLQHLTPLLSLPTFTALWLTILDFMDKYMHADKSDLLYEAIPESLKNMLLVMDTAGIFQSAYGNGQLWTITWDRIDAFLPGLRDEVFKSHQPETTKDQNEASDALPETTADAIPEDHGDGLAAAQSEAADVHAKDSVERRSSVDEVQVVNSMRPGSPLTTEMHYPPSSSVILQPPLPTTVVSCAVGIPLASLSTTSLSTAVLHAGSVSVPVASASIPLIINSSLIGETTLPLSPPHPQVLSSTDSKTPVVVPTSSP